MHLKFKSSVMKFKFLASSLLLLTSSSILQVNSDTTWVWSKNQSPQSTGSNFGATNLGNTNTNTGRGDIISSNSAFPQSPSSPSRDRFQSGGGNSAFPQSPVPQGDTYNNGKLINGGGGVIGSSFPESPSRPTGIDHSAIPDDTIRVGVGHSNSNGQAEPRLIPGIQNFVSNTLQNLAAGTSGASVQSSNGPAPGLFSIGNQLITNILQGVPQFAGSAIGLLLGRPSKGNAATLPASGSNVNIGNGGSGGSSIGSSINSGIGNIPILNPSGSSLGSRPASTNTGSSNNCRCIPLNSCFLPSRPNGDCSGGNVQCCLTQSNRLDSSSSGSGNNDFPESPSRLTRENAGTSELSQSNSGLRVGQVRAGLLQNIVRGGSNIVDDTLDLLLYRYYTEADKQKLANRIAKSS